MFSLITIKHSGSPIFPRYFKVDYKNSKLKIRITYGHSLISVEPTLYSSNIKGIPMFYMNESNILSDNSTVDFTTYTERLIAFLEIFIPANYAQINTEMDMLRHLFIINDMKTARVFLDKMPRHGDVKMLTYIAKKKEFYSSFQAEYTSKYQVTLGNTTGKSIKSHISMAYNENIDKIINISQGLNNEQTKCIFILNIINLISPNKLLSVLDKINIRNSYLKVYLNIKVCEKLFNVGLSKMAVYKMIITAINLEYGQDLKIREELIKIALSKIADEKWKRKVLQLINITTPDEIQQYSWKDINMPIIIKKNNRIPFLSISNHCRIFSIAAFKEYHTNFCTGGLVIFNKNKAMVDGIFTKASDFIPIFSDSVNIKIDSIGNYSKVENNDTLDLECFLLADGRRIPIEKSFKMIKANGQVVPKKIAQEKNKTIIDFEISENIRLVELNKKFGVLKRKENKLEATINQNFSTFTLEVEILEGVYEEQVFNI